MKCSAPEEGSLVRTVLKSYMYMYLYESNEAPIPSRLIGHGMSNYGCGLVTDNIT